MTDPIKPRGLPAHRSSYSLASLALMVTVLAMVLASVNFGQCLQQITKLFQERPLVLAILFASSAIIGAVVGFTHLLFHGFSWRALLVSLVSGALAGGLGAMLTLAPGSIQTSLIAVAVILGTTLAFRLGVE
jgi:hypothetical protein